MKTNSAVLMELSNVAWNEQQLLKKYNNEQSVFKQLIESGFVIDAGKKTIGEQLYKISNKGREKAWGNTYKYPKVIIP